jgi:predicted RNase H-like HicB family nuclease
MNGYRFSVVCGRDDDGGWTAFCSEFPDCRARGESYDDALAAVREEIRLRVEDGLGDDELIPQGEEAVFSTFVMAV